MAKAIGVKWGRRLVGPAAMGAAGVSMLVSLVLQNQTMAGDRPAPATGPGGGPAGGEYLLTACDKIPQDTMPLEENSS